MINAWRCWVRRHRQSLEAAHAVAVVVTLALELVLQSSSPKLPPPAGKEKRT